MRSRVVFLKHPNSLRTSRFWRLSHAAVRIDRALFIALSTCALHLTFGSAHPAGRRLANLDHFVKLLLDLRIRVVSGTQFASCLLCCVKMLNLEGFLQRRARVASSLKHRVSLVHLCSRVHHLVEVVRCCCCCKGGDVNRLVFFVKHFLGLGRHVCWSFTAVSTYRILRVHHVLKHASRRQSRLSLYNLYWLHPLLRIHARLSNLGLHVSLIVFVILQVRSKSLVGAD